MKSHNSAEELFKHYELFHDTGDMPAHVAPTRWDTNVVINMTVSDCTLLLTDFFFFVTALIFFLHREDLSMLRQEVQDLHASLKVKLSFHCSVWVHCPLYVHTNTWWCVWVCFHPIGGTMVLWRTQEGVRQSPRTTEASNSFKMFHIYQPKKIMFGI